MKRALAVLVVLGLALADVCSPDYYPTETGWVWQYRQTGAENNTYSLRFDRNGEGFTEVRQYKDRTDRTPWVCETGGLRPVFESVPSPVGNVSVTKRTGVVIPRDWAVGNRWLYRFDLRGRVIVEVNGFVEVDNRVTAKETVEVPAGRFETLRVEAEFRGNFVVNFSSRFTYWFAPGVGVVRSVGEAQNGRTVTELLELKK